MVELTLFFFGLGRAARNYKPDRTPVKVQTRHPMRPDIHMHCPSNSSNLPRPLRWEAPCRRSTMLALGRELAYQTP